MSTFYLDFEGGNDANDGTTFANRWKTVTGGATAARIAPADVVRVMGSPALASLGINGTWTNKSNTVTLASALNATITDCETVFTASANVTATADTTYFRTGTKSASLSIAAGFTTGLAAYFATGLLDLSAYQGITLWVMVRSTTLAASTLSIRLCSDTLGAVSINTLVLPAITLADCWVPVYIDNGAALGAVINSIALYADADPGTVIVYLDNINTVKAAGADALTHRKLIGKNSGADELWWGIREINGTTITLDGTPYNYFGTNQRVGRGYWGVTQTVTTYARDVIRVDQTDGNFASVQDSGTAGNLITFSGGWDRTNMTTQNLETWVDGSGSWGVFWRTNDKDYIHVDLIHGVRWDYGLYHASVGLGCTFGTIKMGHCRTGGIYFRNGGIASATELTGYGGVQAVSSFAPGACTITKLRSISGGLSGGVISGTAFDQWQLSTVTTLEVRNAEWHGHALTTNGITAHCTYGTITVSDCGQVGLGTFGQQHHIRIGTVTCTNNGGAGASLAGVTGRLIIDSMTLTGNAGANGALLADSAIGGHTTIRSLTTSGNTTTVGVSAQTMHGVVEILTSSIAEATKVSVLGAATNSNPYGRLTMRNYLGTVGDHRSWIGGIGGHGTLVSETSVRHTASGLAWKLSPTSTLVDSLMPLRVPLATVRVNASTLVTIKLWMRRTNTGLTGTLFCRGGQLTGVTSDVTDSIGAAIDTWEEQTITFTPSEAGAIDLEVLAYGGTTYSLYYDDLSITQA